jgi:DNA-binding NarL/FixJ family response regulator
MMLEASGEIEVAGEANDGREALELASAQDFDVVLMDLQMPHLNGIEATRKIIDAKPGAKVIVLTMFAGARGYLLKGAEREDILRAVRAVGSGDAVFGPAIATRLMDYFAAAPRTAFPELTDREREILDLVARGRSNVQIAEQLTLSLKTIRTHVSNIFNKLQVADRAGAIAKARDAGLGAQSPATS